MQISLLVFACLAFVMAVNAQKVCPPELTKKADDAFLVNIKTVCSDLFNLFDPFAT